MEVLKYSRDEIAREYSDCAELKDIILALENSTKKLGRVICMVKVNGLKLSESDEERLADTKISEIHEIEIQVSEADIILKNSVNALEDYIQVLRQRVLSASEQFRNSRGQTMAHLFAEIIQSTQLLNEALMTLKPVMLKNANGNSAFNELWQKTENHFLSTISELAAAYEAQDFVLVADVLEYEMHTSVDNWFDIIRAKD
jgi:hypothetical protein